MAQKKKPQMSQRLCRFAMFLAFYSITLSGFLSYMGKEPLSDVTITVVGLLSTVVNLGYFGLSGLRDCSWNKLAAKVHGNADITGHEQNAC